MKRCFSRRALLSGAGAGLGALVLAACDSAPAVSFKGIDITGATYAKNFHLTDAQGRERTLSDFKGQLVVVFFGFTQCPDVCPTTLTRAVEIKRLLGAEGQRLQVIFVTLDPERDTPEVLQAYTQAFDPTFLGLYTDVQQTASVAQEFKIHYQKVPTATSYTIDHGALSYVYDPQGRLRLALRHEQSAQDCADDLRTLLRTA